MKQAVFEPAWYADERYAARERSEVFEKFWIVAGFVSTLKRDGDYFTLPLYDYEIAVHRLQGEIRAYLNACPHRGGPIVLGPAGNTRPVCKYHGWAFREGSALTGLPMASEFERDPVVAQQSCGKGLRPVAVTCLGPVIFVCLSDKPPALEDQFPEVVLKRLQQAGSTSMVLQSDFDAAFNWKLNMENIKDPMHIYFVHPSTFMDMLPVQQAGLEQDRTLLVRQTAVQPHPPFTENLSDVRGLSYHVKSLLSSPVYWFDRYIKRALSAYHYENIVLFPNTNFCSVSGRHFLLQQYLPSTATRFRYRLNVGLVQMTQPFNAAPVLRAIARGERYVINEDCVVLERVQRNLAALAGSKFRFTQGDYEVPILRQMAYLRDHVYAGLEGAST